jgi:hypothetical protein
MERLREKPGIRSLHPDTRDSTDAVKVPPCGIACPPFHRFSIQYDINDARASLGLRFRLAWVPREPLATITSNEEFPIHPHVTDGIGRAARDDRYAAV